MRAKNAGNVAAMHHFGRNVLPQCTAYKKWKAVCIQFVDRLRKSLVDPTRGDYHLIPCN
jgi:hypothetical protein